MSNGSIEQQADAWYRVGYQSHQRGDLPAAEKAYRQVLAIEPQHAGALHLLGILAAQAELFEPAIALMTRAAAIAPQDFSILNNLGNTLVRAGRFEEALMRLDEALRLTPQAAQLHNNRGNALYELDRYEEALLAYDRAIELQPEHAQAWTNKATTLVNLHRHEQALECAEHAIALSPDSALAHNARGMAFYGLRRWPEASRSFVQALRLRPDYTEAQYNCGILYHHMRLWSDAHPLLDAAARREPSHAAYQSALADNHYGAGDYQAALDVLDRAEAAGVLLRGLAFTRSMLTSAVCDWRRRDQEVAGMRALAATSPTTPFAVLGLIDDPVLQRDAARCWIEHKYFVPEDALAFVPVETEPGQKLRIGYFSADFREHATMHLMAEFFELHDRHSFEIVAFSFGAPVEDSMHRRARAAFDRWEDVSQRSDREIVDLARRLRLDIAVDLKGFTSEARPAIFLQRLAPIQINWLGYPGSFGHAVMDYLLADRTLIAAGDEVAYAEKIVRLPRTYQVNDRKRNRSLQASKREDHGLPAEGFVYCCFNNNYKISPQVFDVWMRILLQTPGSVLWLLEDSEQACSNLRREAQSRGVDPARLVFAPRAPTERHLQRLPLADLFLDTHPYNAHTTASEALWMGLPLLTLQGRSFASRVASSLLNAAHLPQLVTTTLADYEALATRLAASPEELAGIRQHLIERALSLPLFDTPRLTRDVEQAYRLMMDRYRAGLTPDHIEVPDAG